MRIYALHASVLLLPFLAQAAPGQTVIQAGTHIVLVNVVAKDKHGKPVSDLTRGDFVLRDNGQEQKISLFALEDAGQSPGPRVSSASLTFTNRPGPGIAAVTAFLFDELNTRLTDQEFAKKEFLRYLRALPADSRVAFFVLGDDLWLLHDFSDDPASLEAAIEKHRNRAGPEAEAAGGPPASANSLTGDAKTSAQWDSFMQSAAQQYAEYAETVRATRTAAALDTIAAHLEGVAGRKTLIWISGGFPIQQGLRNTVDSMPQGDSTARAGGSAPHGGKGAGTGGGGKSGGHGQSRSAASNPSASSDLTPELPGAGLSYESDVARAIRALNEADVAVYPVDARGVMTPAVFQADRSSLGKRNRPPKALSVPDFDYETMQTLAEETGGQAFHHINDLSAAMREAATDARVSYSLAFTPSAPLDGTYHKLEVIVSRPGVKVRYRPGYVASPDAAVAPSLAEALANPVPLAAIGFSVHLDPVEGGYKASVTIDARNITLQPKDGKWTGSLQFLVVVGKVEQLTTIPLSFSEAMFHQIEEKGIVLGARVKTTPGAHGFSMGFRDIPSGSVGTLHVAL